MIVFSRRGGRRRPGYDERIAIDGSGAFRMWRSVATASQPPTPVGLFAGRLGDADLSRLAEAERSVRDEGDLQELAVPDSPIDLIEVAGRRATFGMRTHPAGPWGHLAEELRRLLSALGDRPVSAVGLKLAEDGASAALVHVGEAVIELRLGDLRVGANLWNDEEDDIEGRWEGHLDGPEEVTAGPGWTSELPFAHGFVLEQDHHLAVEVTFGAVDEGRLATVLLSGSAPPGR